MLRRDFIKLLSVTPFIGSVPIISQQHTGLEHLIKHGCNTLVFGPPTCGKTRISLKILEKHYNVAILNNNYSVKKNYAVIKHY